VNTFPPQNVKAKPPPGRGVTTVPPPEAEVVPVVLVLPPPPPPPALVPAPPPPPPEPAAYAVFTTFCTMDNPAARIADATITNNIVDCFFIVETNRIMCINGVRHNVVMLFYMVNIYKIPIEWQLSKIYIINDI
jgi:hypothetical protein